MDMKNMTTTTGQLITSMTNKITTTRIKLTNRTEIETTEMEQSLTTMKSTMQMSTTQPIIIIIASDPCNRIHSLIEGYTENLTASIMVSADIDHNNQYDIIIGGKSLKMVAILFNEGNGKFRMQKIFDVNDLFPNTILTSDINNDGLMDIIFLNKINAQLIIFFNDWNHTFIEHMNYPIGKIPTHFTIGDVNNDGYNDTDGISIHFNDGSENFSSEPTFYRNELPTQFLVIGDLNNDSNLDIIAVNGFNDTIIILLNIGNGKFVISNTISTDSMPQSIALLDINHDNKQHFALIYSFSDKIEIFLNNDDGTFIREKQYLSGEKPHSIVIGDVNNDKKDDIIVANTKWNDIGIFLNIGDGSFTNQISYEMDSKTYSLALSDINNDNQLDIILGHEKSIGILYTHCPS